jgi:hypothetical protein
VKTTLTGVTKKQVTPGLKKALRSTFAQKAKVDPKQVTLTFQYTKTTATRVKVFFQLKSNTKAATRRLAAGKSVTVTATIAVPDAVAASKVSAGIAKVKPAAFTRTLKKELVKEGSDVDLKAVTATIEVEAPIIRVEGLAMRNTTNATNTTSVHGGSTLNAVNRLGAALVAVAVLVLV